MMARFTIKSSQLHLRCLERLLLKKASHEIRIVFFTRVLFPTLMSEEGILIDNHNRVYLDVYKSVVTVKAIKNN